MTFLDAVLSARPHLAGACDLRTATGIGDRRTLLHAGPAYADPGEVPPPVRSSAAAAMLFEGWAGDAAEALAAIDRGSVRLEPAQDHGVVTPLAFVVSPSMAVLRVEDAGSGKAFFSPVNDGPPEGALRFGSFSPAAIGRLGMLARGIPMLDAALEDPVAMIPLMAQALRAGDDLHAEVAQASALLRSRLAPRLAGPLHDYLMAASQFALNPVMATCALLLDRWGHGRLGMVTRIGGNGVDLGWSTAGAQDWRRMRSAAPMGVTFAGCEDARVLPAIGDSMVIDACGLGAAALRHAPSQAALAQVCGSAHFLPAASGRFLQPHPAFPPDLRFGLRLDPASPTPFSAVLARIDADGRSGLVGRGIHTALLTP